MQNFFGVKVDTASMTDEELEEVRKRIAEMLSNIDSQLLMRKMAKYRISHSSY